MARAVNVKQQNWARWESGVVSPGADMISTICRVHACSSDWLLGLDERGKSAAQVKTGNNSAVAIGANARATVRGTFAARGESAAPGDAPMCAKCPFKKAAKNFQKIFAK